VCFTNTHLEVPFPSVGYDTIWALTDLAAIFKLKLQQSPSPAPQAAPPMVFPHPSIAPSSNQILNSLRNIARQMRSQMTIHTQDIPNVPLSPRVIIPRTLRQSPPRVPYRSQSLSPRNFSKDYFCSMDSAHMAIALGQNHWSKHHQSNTVIHPVSGKEMDYLALTKDPVYSHFGREALATNAGAILRNSRHSRSRYMFLHQTETHPK
jgi:hypothetical protein